MLGISIGVAAYICSVSLGRGAAVQIQEQLASLGENLIQIEAGARSVNGVRSGNLGMTTLVPADMRAIRGQIPLISRVSPNVDSRIHVVRGNQNWSTTVRGVTPDYLQIRRWVIAAGTTFSDEDVDRDSKVCIIGQTIATQLFTDEDPVGGTILVQNLPCRVVGVLQAKGLSVNGQDQDDVVLMPYSTTMKKIMGQTWLDDIFCSAVTAGDLHLAESQIDLLLRERHQIGEGKPVDFNLRHPTAVLQAREESQQTMTLLLACIASVALLVGGIGIMNIMLASVTDRTREIGIRLAVGAGERDIVKQFLAESLTLSMTGGFAGTVLGVSASLIMQMVGWNVILEPGPIVLALLFSATVGIFFGSYPAVLASRLDPVEALGR